MVAPSGIRRIIVSALVALAISLGIETLVAGYSSDAIVKLLQFLAVLILGGAIIGGVILLLLVQLGNWQSPASDDEFDQLVKRSEALAAVHDVVYEDEAFADELPMWAGKTTLDGSATSSNDEQAEFDAALQDAVRALPAELHVILEHVAVVVSDDGAVVPGTPGDGGAYGLYVGDTIAHDYFADRVLIFRDTLMRDFGDDPLRLRAEISRTLRHELAHHLGYGERGVRDLGL
jgi:predicted Zn-dependent protease with MMP-like domain